jgi:hypothetical protein
MSFEHELPAVVPDLHGRAGVLSEILKRYESIVVAGDMVDGQDTFGVLDLIAEHRDRALPVAGNHEITLAAALFEKDPDARETWVEQWREPYHKNVLGSYGLSNTVNLEAAQALKAVMPPAHKTVLLSARPYYLRNGLLVVHAGITSEPWHVQAKVLDEFYAGTLQGDYGGEIPLQLCGKRRADAYYSVSERVADPETEAQPIMDEAGIRVMVNGHWHRRSSDSPWKFGGRILHLANKPSLEEIPVYEPWSGEIKVVEAARPISVPSNYAASA